MSRLALPGANDPLGGPVRSEPRSTAASLQVVRDRQATVNFVPAQRAAGSGRVESNALIERAMAMDRIDSTESSESRRVTAEPTCVTERGNQRRDFPSIRVPVFRGAVFAGFIDRPGAPSGTTIGAARDGMARRAWETVKAEAGTHHGIAGLRAENGIVRLAGEIDDPHELLALRRIAASLPGTMLVIDNLWVSCE